VSEIHTTLAGASGGQCDVTWQNDYEVRVFLVYKLLSPVLAEMSSLGLINPAEIVWELLPYSFVVDWFVPVSAWLSALTADVGFSFLTGGYSNKAEIRAPVVSGATGFSNGSITHYDLVSPSYFGRNKAFVRTCFEGSPVPGFYVKNPLSFTHVANAAALLKQAFRP
jgi:hypothetical protein